MAGRDGRESIGASSQGAKARPGNRRVAQWAFPSEEERRLWFSREPGAYAAISRATVEGATVHEPLRTAPPPRTAIRPGRLLLWRAAARMFASHPLLGVGPDNFRLTYPAYAGLRVGDPRMHSNNMYVEILAGGGLITGIAFLWLLARAARLCVSGIVGGRAGGVAIASGIAAAGLAMALHGLVDSFLGFAPTYVLFSLTLGLAAACAGGVETRPDAHRV